MLVEEYFRGSSSTPISTNKFVCWQPSILGVVKINFDDSLQNNSATREYTLRDRKGEVIKVGVAYYGQTSIIMAKVQALRGGVREAIVAGCRKITIK